MQTTTISRQYFMTTKRIGFSTWNLSDRALAESLWGTPEVTRYICADGVFSTEEVLQRLDTEIRNFETFHVQYWPIFELTSSNLIGCCGLRPCLNDNGRETTAYELGFHLRATYWGMGFAAEAAKAVVQYVFSALGVTELRAGHHPENTASRILLGKLGFEYTGDSYYEPTGLCHPTYRLFQPTIRKECQMNPNTDTMPKAAGIFGDWHQAFIAAGLKGKMGTIYTAGNPDTTSSAMAVIGDLVFYAGIPSKELIALQQEGPSRDFTILVPQSDGWSSLIERQYGDRANKTVRYAMEQDPASFDRKHLRSIVATLSPEYSLRMIDETLYHQCKAESWSQDLVSQYHDFKMYEAQGIGVVIMAESQIIAGASSYVSYSDGIEIQIDTKEEFRRKGLASICGAKLILECLERNLRPSWDAHNKESVSLAKKLGYRLDHEYTAYEVWGEQF